ncbi:MAG: hypothetical protein ACPHWZ_06785 [Longimicrobiales bacterium]
MSSGPIRNTAGTVGSAMIMVCAVAFLPADAVGQSSGWVMPRLADGTPDLQGNWSNATMTPIVRPPGVGEVLTPQQVSALEQGRQDFIASDYEDSDPDRGAPPAGGELTGDPIFDAATGGTGGYNQFFVDAGDNIAIYNGEPRSSLIVYPEDGRRAAFTPEGERRVAERVAFNRQFNQYDNPENRPLAERCMMSFGSNGGPPMLPNYFYNNNYTIVQTPDAVMIMTEMVHDVRIIRMGEPQPLPGHMRPWLGDSWGRWEGDTLVVETTNIHPDQPMFALSAAQFVPSASIRVIERFTRPSDHQLNYEFTVEDPVMLTAPVSGEMPFNRLDGMLYEYACHEANYALENVLSGARAQERNEGR